MQPQNAKNTTPTPPKLGKNGRLIQIPSRISLRIQLHSREPIPQIPKPVLPRIVIIMDILPVLTAELLQHMEKVNPAPRVQRRDRPPRLPIREPRPTLRRPHGPRHKRRDVLKVIVDGALRRRHGLDALGLALFDDAGNVLCDLLAGGEDASVADGAVGAEEHCGGQLVCPVGV